MKLSKPQIAIISLIVANIIWGAGVPIIKWTLQDIPPLTFAFARYFLSALIILPFTLKKLKIKFGDIYLLVILSVIGLAFRIAYNFYGLEYAPSINDLIISSTAPIFIFVGAVFFFHEKLKKKTVNGMIISFIGVMIIVFQPGLTSEFGSSILGNIFLLTSMALNVVYVLLLKELSKKYTILTLLFWSFFIASITLLPFSIYEISKANLSHLFQAKALYGTGFTVFFSTVSAYSLMLYGLRYIKASEIGIFSYVDPFVGIAVANSLLGEQITASFFTGACLVFLGILLAENRFHYHPFHLLRAKYHKAIVEDNYPA